MQFRPSVLFSVSECVPFAKVGGLGDVAGALPAALAAHGHDVRIVMPRYGFISTAGMRRHDAPLGVPLGATEAWCAVHETRLPGTNVPVYLLEHDALFGRDYVYDPRGSFCPDAFARACLLSRGTLQLAKWLGFTPDVVHAHDWFTAIVPVMLNELEREGPLARTASVLTLHNLHHQAKFPKHELALAGLGPHLFRQDGLEDFGSVSPLKGGLYHATKITTVSPTYAREIRTHDGGAGLEHVVRFRGADTIGILNGIDDRVWNPADDPNLPASFSADDLAGKDVCKRELQRELGLDPRPEVPLVGIVSRLVEQKGLDVVAEALDRLLALDVQIVVLGAGDPRLEAAFEERSSRGDGSFRAKIGFDEGLAHRIEAGSDLFLMPSRFEPCGLNQMYSQRYGTLPVVRATGGLDDSVEACDPATGRGTGFKLWELSADTLVDTLRFAVEVWHERPLVFRAMQVRAMKKRLGWDAAAELYADVYRWAVEARRA